MDNLETAGQYASSINHSFGRAVTTIEGWMGTLGMMYFQPGTIGATILGVCVMDLFTGTMLSRKITRILASPDKSHEFPELMELITTGKKLPFTWKRWGQWLDKMLVVFGLIAGCEWFKLYLNHNEWSADGGAFAIGAVYFVLLFTNLRSIVRNTALVTENSLLLSIWKWMGSDNGIPPIGNFSFLQQHTTSTTTPMGVKVTEVTTTIESENKANEHPGEH